MSREKLKSFINNVKSYNTDSKLDLSVGEDLSIGIMNLISIEEHLFFTSQKTGKQEYVNLLNRVRSMRTELLGEIIKDYEGEIWCVSKHLLSASMRLMEVGTKESKKGNDKGAWSYFEKSYALYNMFWELNLKEGKSLVRKFNKKLKNALDCCKE